MALFAPLHTGQFIVRPRTRARRRMTVSVIALFALLLPYITFEAGRMLGGYSVVNSTRTRLSQAQHIRALESEVAQLQRKLNTTQIGQTVDQHSTESLQRTIDELQGQLQQQRSELAFYQSIVSPTAGTPNEPSVQRVEIEPTQSPTQFLLRMVLIQPMQTPGQAQGSLQVEVTGVRNGAAATVSLRELTGSAQLNSLKFAYRYFQIIEQEIELAPDFVPSNVMIEIHAAQHAPQRQSFTWQLQPAGTNIHVQTP